jgi:hypothetical protein
VGGRRKGREEVGEAWLLEGTRRTGRWDIRRAVWGGVSCCMEGEGDGQHTCHFKHAGL